MTLRNAIVASASLVWITLSAGAARAEMTCATYLRGVGAQDEYILREASEIALRLTDSRWSSPAMDADAKTLPPSANLRLRLMLRQLSRDCRALPRESVDRLVAVHLKALASD